MRTSSRRLRWWPAAAVLAAAMVGGAGSMSGAAPGRVRVPSEEAGLFSCPSAVRRLGLIAFVARGRLKVVDLGPCRVTVRRAAGATEVRFSRFSRDARWIMLVRSRVLPSGFGGSSRDTIELVRASGIGGAVPVVSFTSGGFSYYDHFDWPYEIDWYQPR